jgi:hypothetical protein
MPLAIIIVPYFRVIEICHPSLPLWPCGLERVSPSLHLHKENQISVFLAAASIIHSLSSNPAFHSPPIPKTQMSQETTNTIYSKLKRN